MKETYSVKPPKHIEIGDPWYFKMFKGDELDRLTVRKYIEPFYDACRITLEETPCEEMPELMLLDMTVIPNMHTKYWDMDIPKAK